jgi:prepilin-type processing-associated H-X9-DG protein
VFKRFPAAATRAPKNAWMHGPTWWVYTLPYVEQDNVYKRTAFNDNNNPGSNYTFWFGDAGAVNQPVYEGAVFPMMRCPGSSLPEWNLADTTVIGDTTPYKAYDSTYTCILGSDLHPTADTTARNGPVSDGGVLGLRVTAQSAVRVNDVKDGTSNTIMVGEQSDWASPKTSNGSPGLDQFYNDIRSSDSRGSFMGTSYVTPPNGPGSLTNGNCGGTGSTNCRRCYNSTTIVWPIGRKQFDFNSMGDERCGTPIQSVHPGGANVLFADGSVQFLTSSLDLTTFKHLVDRDDGNVVQWQ